VPLSICNHIPVNGGIQVLPVLWRHFLNIPISRSNDNLNDVDQNRLDDIVLDGIPGIRTLVSDVIFDGKNIILILVLLYLTPKYRQEMIYQVTKECNRIVALYKERNPSADYKISIYGVKL
jgi:hypothetical protein